MDSHHITIDFNKFISSISLALDLAEACVFKDYRLNSKDVKSFSELDMKGHNFATHSKKTALIALSLAKKLGFKDDRLNNLYVSAFLHDIGAVDAFSASHTNIDFVYEHSEFGSNIVKKLPLDNSVSKFIRFHHENFDGSGPNGIAGSEIPLESQIIHISDFFELLYDSDKPYDVQKQVILNWVQLKRNKLFDPYLVDMLFEIAEAESFWLDIENINTDPDILERARPKLYSPLSMQQLINISKVFAAIIDKKSSFTHDHSVGLTNYLMKISSLYDFDEVKISKLKIAGLLHDLGKLAIPNSILDKPGKLTKEEFTIIKSHTYYTRLILGKIDGIDDICDWASNHHETLRGTGYPLRMDERDLTLESRILAVCDIYQALTEDRPYRPGMTKDKAMEIIYRLVDARDIDKSVVEKLTQII